MLQGEHSAITSIFIKLPSVIKIFVLSIFEWPLKTGFTVHVYRVQINTFYEHKIVIYTVSYPCFKICFRCSIEPSH